MQRAPRGYLLKQPAGAEKMILADYLAERARAHPISQRLSDRALRFEQPGAEAGCSSPHWKTVSQRNDLTKRLRSSSVKGGLRFVLAIVYVLTHDGFA